MYDIPLFPLNMVLFPGMPIHLHIFEERYKQMINLCISEGRPFGVVLIQKGQEVGGMAEPQSIGCAAQIAQVQPLDDGRMNLVAIGQERFEIKSLNYDNPYLMGTVEARALVQTPVDLEPIAARLRAQITEYLKVLSTIGQTEFDMEKLPNDATELSYLAATLLQIPVEKKQSLLIIDNNVDLIRAVYQTCRQELAILKAMISAIPENVQNAGPFSLN
jgi:Lon protease-like protein